MAIVLINMLNTDTYSHLLLLLLLLLLLVFSSSSRFTRDKQKDERHCFAVHFAVSTDYTLMYLRRIYNIIMVFLLYLEKYHTIFTLYFFFLLLFWLLTNRLFNSSISYGTVRLKIKSYMCRSKASGNCMFPSFFIIYWSILCGPVSTI